MSDRCSISRRWTPILAALLAAHLGFSSPARGEGSAPLTLAKAVEMALAHAPELAVAFATEREAAATVRIGEDAFHPEASVSTSPGYGQGLPGGVGGQLPSVVSVEVRQTLYDPGRRADALEARARWSLSRASSALARTETARKVVLAYGRCWVDEALVTSAERREEIYDRLRLRAEALHAEGRATELEVQHAALQAAQARQVRLERESDRDLDQLELRRLVGWASNVPLVLTGPPLASVAAPGPADDLVLARKADAEMIGLGEADRALARAESLRGRSWTPVVGVGAQYARLVQTPNYEEFYNTFKPDSWTVGMSVVLPVLTGGRTADLRARTKAERERVLAQYRERESQLELQVRRAEASLAQAVARASLARRAEAIAREDLRVAQAMTAEGRTGLPDVDRREVALADAQDDAARAEGALLEARALELALRGELIDSLEASSEAATSPPGDAGRGEFDAVGSIR
jgi:outer membrane protein TolC